MTKSERAISKFGSDKFSKKKFREFYYFNFQVEIQLHILFWIKTKFLFFKMDCSEWCDRWPPNLPPGYCEEDCENPLQYAWKGDELFKVETESRWIFWRQQYKYRTVMQIPSQQAKDYAWKKRRRNEQIEEAKFQNKRTDIFLSTTTK